MKHSSILLVVVFIIFNTAGAWAGSDSAVVPADRIPWSGSWWPLSAGSLINGYAGHPSPLEKYDSYASGYYPAAISAYGLENEYDPSANLWTGYCDEWAAAAILYPEPNAPGDLNGILFNVGDKKGILTLSLKDRVNATFYGKRYRGKEDDDIDDIYPGGAEGFHETLINYIKIQGKPIIMDLDPGVQIWNYPAYRYEMTWYDAPGRRHVTCTVWVADDGVAPDDIGTYPLEVTYTYWLAIDENGDLLDEPGGWESSSHPDFLWYPVSVGTDWLMDDDLVNDIVSADLDRDPDRFGENDTQAKAATVAVLKKDRFYAAAGFDEDWYKVYLQEGDDFTVFAVSNTTTPLEDMTMTLFDPDGYPIGTRLYHGARLGDAPKAGWFTVQVAGLEAEELPYYHIEFFSSPVLWLPHLDFNNGWRTDTLVLNDTGYDSTARLSFMDGVGEVKEIIDFNSFTDEQTMFSLNEEFSEHGNGRGWARLMHVLADDIPTGFYTYAGNTERVNIPFAAKGYSRLYLPAVRESGYEWTGLAMLNADYTQSAAVTMSSFDSGGNLLGTLETVIFPFTNLTGLLSSLWGTDFPDQTEWIEMESTKDLQAICLWGDLSNADNYSLAGLNLLNEDRQDTVLYIPHLEYDWGWSSEIYILNPGEEPAAVTWQGYASTGQLVATATSVLPAKGVLRGDIGLFLPAAGASCEWVKIVSTQPLTGFTRFSKPGQSAAVPVACGKDMANAFMLYYIPNGQTEWTGLALLNPNDKKTDVWADPYDAEGNRLLAESTHLWYNVPNGIAAKANAVGIIADLFPGLPSDTALLKIYSEKPLVGFGLHGDYAEVYLDTIYLQELE